MRDKTNIFTQKSSIIHNGQYDYSKSIYVNAITKLCITCPIHGDFFMRPNSHLSGQGCKKCGIENRPQNNPKMLEVFVQDSKKIHGNKYDYSNVNYINNGSNVILYCNTHKITFDQTPSNHFSVL